MVKILLHLFAVSTALLFQVVQCNSASASVNEERIRSILQRYGKSLVPPKVTPSSSFSYILKPFSTIDSILPFESYASHTYESSASSIGETALLPTVTSSVNINNVLSKSKIPAAAIHAAQLSQPLLSSSSSVSQGQAQISSSYSKSVVGKSSPSISNIISAQQVVSNSLSAPMPIRTLTANETRPGIAVTIAEVVDPEEFIRPCYRKGRKVPFSQYWIPRENEWDETNNGDRVFLGGDVKVKMYDKNNKEIGIVPETMYQKCRMEGTCLLENGDLMNIEDGSATHRFIKVGGRGREHNVFGLGSGSQNLVPFISVAANDIPYGQKLYISQLDGLDLGSNMKHNGCVRVDDDSWSFDSCQIDFFVVSYVDYLWLDLEDEVSIRYAECQLLNYTTKHHLTLMKASTNEKIIPTLLNAKKTL